MPSDLSNGNSDARNFPAFALDYTNPDFAKYAESYGAVGMKAREGDNLSELLHSAFSLKKLC